MESDKENNGDTARQLSYDGRLTRLEAVVENLANGIGRLTADVTEMSRYSRSHNQTNWGNIFAGITLVVALTAGYVGIPMSNFKAQFAAHRSEMDDRFREADKHAISERQHNVNWALERFRATDERENLRNTHVGNELGLLREWKEDVQRNYLSDVAQLADKLRHAEAKEQSRAEQLQLLAERTGRLEGQLRYLEKYHQTISIGSTLHNQGEGR